MSLDIDVILRDYVTQGDPSSGTYSVVKSQLRQFLKALARSGGGSTVATKAELDAITDADDNASGAVWGDSTAANNGIYSWDDSASTWNKIAGLPLTLAVLTNVAGTANAITADTETGVDPAEVKALIFTPASTNTSTTMTITLNSGSAEDIKNGSGGLPAIGDFVANVTTILFKVGSEWRQIFSSQTGATFDHQGDYNAGTTYTEGQVITGSDDSWYQLKTASATGDDPVSGGSGNWLQILAGAAIPDGTVTYAKIAKETEDAIASAATTDLGSSSKYRILVTGTTAITSFGTSSNDRHLVRFADALTLTYDATSLILPSGADITTATGDVAEFASDSSGNWRCVNYQRASGQPLAGSNDFDTLSDTISVLRYNRGVDFIRTLRASDKSGEYGINSFADGFSDIYSFEASESSNYIYDTTSSPNQFIGDRNAIYPTRSVATSVGQDACTSTSGWTTFNTGTASVTAATDADNPVVPNDNVFYMNTGATVSSVAGIQKNFGTIPDAAFSIGVHIYVGSRVVGDSFEFQVISASGYTLRCRVYTGSFEVFQDGAWQQLATYGGGNLYTEFWVNCTQQSGSTYKVDLYAGTEFLGTRTGALAGSGTAGLVVLQLNSGSNANQGSRVCYVDIGERQTADNMTLTSVAMKDVSTSPTKARFVALVENTSNGLDLNNNVNVQISQNDGVSWEDVTLTDYGVYRYGDGSNNGGGAVDNYKSIKIVAGELTFTNTGATLPKYRILTSENVWVSFMGTFLEWF